MIFINTLNFFWIFNYLPLLFMTTYGEEFLNGPTLNRDEYDISWCPYNGSFNGNCSFYKSMCGWTNNKSDQLDWEMKDNHIQASTGYTGKDVRAQLISPSMCEPRDIDLCVQIRFKIDGEDGGKMKFFIQCDKACNTSEWETTDWKGGEWQTALIPFKSHDTFKMIIEGHKYKDTWGKDSDFFIDDIRYFKNSCGNTVTPTSSSSVSGKQTQTTEHINYTMNTTQSRDTNKTYNLYTVFEGNADLPLIATISILCAIIVIIIILIVIIIVARRKKRNIGKVDPMRSYSAREDDAHFNTDCGTDADNTGHVGEHNYSNLTEDQQTVHSSADRNNEYSTIDMDGFTQNIYLSLHGREIRL